MIMMLSGSDHSARYRPLEPWLGGKHGQVSRVASILNQAILDHARIFRADQKHGSSGILVGYLPSTATIALCLEAV